MPSVSVVIPTYNDEETIRRALDSLVSQSFQDFEVIVVDDGDDDTADIVREYGYQVVEREQDGIASALNRGVTEANGKYIARQDADDTSHPNRLERQVSFLQNHEEVAAVGTGAYMVKSGSIRARRRVLERVPTEAFRKKNHLIHGSVMMRRELFEEVGCYDERLDHIEDLELWIRLSKQYEIANIDEPLYNFTIHDQSIYARKLEEVLLLHEFINLRERGIPEKIEEAVYGGCPAAVKACLEDEELSQLYRTMAIEYLRYGRLQDAKASLFRMCIKCVSLVDIPLFLLSFTTPSVSKQAANIWRDVLNCKIVWKNRSE